MKILLIEDEAPAARRLQKLLLEIEPDIEILAVLESVEEGIEWLTNNEHPDVLFSDIQLADGLSFLIFDQVPPKCPVIFVTAFDQYAIKAFQVNSIDYLLKPCSKEQLEISLDKLKQNQDVPKPNLKELVSDMVVKSPKKRFLISKGDSLIPVNTADIAYIYTEDKAVMLKVFDNTSYFINYSLDDVEQLLDSEQFFRLNRQVVVNITAIDKISHYFNGKLKVNLSPAFASEVLVSRMKASTFKHWLEK